MPSILRNFVICAGAGVLISAPLRADQPDASEALSVARNWVSEIDAGRYEQSYDEGGAVLHTKVPEDMWVRVLKTERPPLGKPLTREELGHSYKPDGFEGTNGEFMTVSFRTAFENRPGQVEFVVLRREDGKWRGVGYNFGPEQVDSDPDAGPITTTTSSTNTPPTTGSQVIPATRKKQ